MNTDAVLAAIEAARAALDEIEMASAKAPGEEPEEVVEEAAEGEAPPMPPMPMKRPMGG